VEDEGTRDGKSSLRRKGRSSHEEFNLCVLHALDFATPKLQIQNHEFYKEVQHSKGEIVILGVWHNYKGITSCLVTNEIILPSIGLKVCRCRRSHDGFTETKARFPVSCNGTRLRFTMPMDLAGLTNKPESGSEKLVDVHV
jgi:hypothetical protein